MRQQPPPPSPKRPTPQEITHALKVSVFSAVVGLGLFTAACYFTYVSFETRIPHAKLYPWVIGTVVLLIVWLVLALALLVRRPSVPELIRIWAPVAKLILLGSDGVVVASIWLFLPHADQALMLMMMIFYVCHIPTQVLCSPENTEINRIGIVAVIGSVIVFLLIRGGDIEMTVAAFMAVYAVMMYFVSDVIRQTMRDAVAARMASDAAAQELEKALISVANERDAKTRFIAAASHDLGQPLQAANLFFDQTLRAPDESSRARAAQGVQRAFAAAEQLLSHMLNHLRLEADAVEPHLSWIDMHLCLNRHRTQYLPMAAQEGIELRVARCQFKLHLDPALLDRAMGNLINNAIVHSGAHKILVGCRRAGAHRVRIYVIDDGVGIGSADAKHVFQDFYRGSDSRARSNSGFGLGLSSVRRIADLMDGTAVLDQRWIHGAAFYLEFPNSLPVSR